MRIKTLSNVFRPLFLSHYTRLSLLNVESSQTIDFHHNVCTLPGVYFDLSMRKGQAGSAPPFTRISGCYSLTTGSYLIAVGSMCVYLTLVLSCPFRTLIYNYFPVPYSYMYDENVFYVIYIIGPSSRMIQYSCFVTYF